MELLCGIFEAILNIAKTGKPYSEIPHSSSNLCQNSADKLSPVQHVHIKYVYFVYNI